MALFLGYALALVALAARWWHDCPRDAGTGWTCEVCEAREEVPAWVIRVYQRRTIMRESRPPTTFQHSHEARVAPKRDARHPYEGITVTLEHGTATRRYRNDEHSQFPFPRSEGALVARPERSAREDIAEGLEAMRLDEVDDEATYQHLLDIERGRWEFPLLDLTRAEAAWLGAGVEYGAEHHTLWDDGTARLRERIAQRVTQQIDPEVRAKQVTREIMGVREVLVLDDQDEMLPEEVVWEHAGDLVDALGY